MSRIEPPRMVLVPLGIGGIVVTDFRGVDGLISGSTDEACCED
jgi:hypothetical protein